MTTDKKLLQYLSNFISDHKQRLFNEIIEDRTRYVTVVLEDIYQPHNASAVLRSCDCFGIQDVHIIENKNQYNVNKQVALGASKWLSLYKYNEEENNTLNCINSLKEKGYKIIATTPHKESYSLPELPLDEKIALMFGTEKDGLTDLALQNADAYLKIPMYGFTESFNISVSAALCLYEVSQKLREIPQEKWKLTKSEKEEIKYNWVKKVVKKAELIEQEYLKKI